MHLDSSKDYKFGLLAKFSIQSPKQTLSSSKDWIIWPVLFKEERQLGHIGVMFTFSICFQSDHCRKHGRWRQLCDVVLMIITSSCRLNMLACCRSKYQHISGADRRSLPGVVSGVGSGRNRLYLCASQSCTYHREGPDHVPPFNPFTHKQQQAPCQIFTKPFIMHDAA